jgi:hypothetical protein
MGSWFSSLFDTPKIRKLNLTRGRKSHHSPMHRSLPKGNGIIAQLFQTMENNGMNFSNSHSHSTRK